VVERSDTTGEPSDALVPGAYCPSHPSSRTIYGLIAYLRQVAERISSDPFDPHLARHAANPGGADLLDVTFDQEARIDEIRGHYRRSRIMVSDKGSPLMVTGASSGSSSSMSREGSGSEVMRPMLSRC
jgi:hypothetical protein